MRAVTSAIIIMLLTSTLALSVNIQTVEARTIVVPDDYPTIQEAINNANVGDTILVGAGTYYENVVVNKSVSLVGEDKYSTIIDANSSGSAVCVVADFVRMRGFTVQNGRHPMLVSYGDGICVSSNGNNISDNIVINNNYYGIRLIRTSNNIITGNYIASNYAGIELSGSDHNAITGNNVSSNTHDGIRVSSGGNNQIWSMNADGSSQTRLTNETSYDYHPQWSPDGSKIAYIHMSPCDYLDSDIWVMNPDGTGKTQITTGSPGYSLGGWSLDGSQIVFQSSGFGVFGIWIMDSDGTNQKQLTSNWTDRAPAWCPDGTKIAFSKFGAGTSQDTYTYDIWIMNPDGTNQTQLTSNIPYTMNPSWSPDGSMLAFESFDIESRRTGIWITNIDGTNPTELVSPQSYGLSPQWSPDGTRIAYCAPDDSWQWDIWVMNARARLPGLTMV